MSIGSSIMPGAGNQLAKNRYVLAAISVAINTTTASLTMAWSATIVSYVEVMFFEFFDFQSVETFSTTSRLLLGSGKNQIDLRYLLL